MHNVHAFFLSPILWDDDDDCSIFSFLCLACCFESFLSSLSFLFPLSSIRTHIHTKCL